MSMMEIIIKIDQLNLMRSVWRGGGGGNHLLKRLYLLISVFFINQFICVYIFYELYMLDVILFGNVDPLYCP